MFIMFLVENNFFTIIMSELYVFLWKRSESVSLLNYSPFSTWLFFLLPWQWPIQLTKTYLRVYTISLQSFTTTHSQTNTQCFSEYDYPVCLQTSLGSLRPAVLQHLGAVVQKRLNEELVKYLPWTCAKKKKLCYIHDLLDVINKVHHTKFQLNQQEHKIFSLNCLTLLWPWNMFKAIESGMNR